MYIYVYIYIYVVLRKCFEMMSHIAHQIWNPVLRSRKGPYSFCFEKLDFQDLVSACSRHLEPCRLRERLMYYIYRRKRCACFLHVPSTVWR